MKFIFVGLFLYYNAWSDSGIHKERPKAPEGIAKLSEKERKILPALCARPEPAVIDSIKLNDTPEFFFRPYPRSNKIIYSRHEGENNFSNISLDLGTGKKTKLPGGVDGFPSPDEKLLVVPIISNGLKRLAIYDLEKPTQQPFEDFAMIGYYQSCGVLEENLRSTTYRVMIDSPDVNAFYFRDYKLKKNFLGRDELYSEMNRPLELCKSMRGELSLPMMSKDGKYLAAFNNKTQTTNIYTIDGTTGECTQPQNLGMTTGKVDFSFGGDLVTYSQIAVRSAANRLSDNYNWIRTPNAEMVANVYTRNLRTGETKALTHYHDTSVLYPSFNAKNEIIARKFQPDGVEFVKLNPYVSERNIELKPDEKCWFDKAFLKIFALGSTFLSYCAVSTNAAEWNTESIALLGKDLSKEQCYILADWWEKPGTLKDILFIEKFDQGEKIPKALEEISPDDLRAVCDSN